MIRRILAPSVLVVAGVGVGAGALYSGMQAGLIPGGGGKGDQQQVQHKTETGGPPSAADVEAARAAVYEKLKARAQGAKEPAGFVEKVEVQGNHLVIRGY